jgi:Ran GTPase-activating protein (RanGAP) involved in mRNA processing and transport
MGTTLHWWILWVVLVDLIWATGKCNKQDTEGLTHLPVRCKEILLSGGVVGDDGAKRLAHLMGAYSAVVLLDMPRNDVSDTGMVALASSLGSEGRDRHLQQLLLPGNKVTRSGAISLGKALQTNAQLSVIDLSHNLIDGTGAGAIFAGAAQNAKTALAKVHLDGNNMGDQGLSAIAQAFSSSAQLRATLTDLTLSNTGMTPLGASQLAAVLSKTNIHTLDLSHNKGLGDMGAVAVFESLAMNGHLHKLLLGSCQITQLGMSALAVSLATNEELRTLSLDHNKIGAAGGKTLASMLTSNQGLTRLDVNNAHIGDVGAAAMGQALTLNHKLQQLSLGSNSIGLSGVRSLARGIDGNPALRSLSLMGNPISNAGLETLYNSVQSNGALAALALTEVGLNATLLKLLGNEFDSFHRRARALEHPPAKVQHIGKAAKRIEAADAVARAQARPPLLVEVATQLAHLFSGKAIQQQQNSILLGLGCTLGIAVGFWSSANSKNAKRLGERRALRRKKRRDARRSKEARQAAKYAEMRQIGLVPAGFDDDDDDGDTEFDNLVPMHTRGEGETAPAKHEMTRRRSAPTEMVDKSQIPGSDSEV